MNRTRLLTTTERLERHPAAIAVEKFEADRKESFCLDTIGTDPKYLRNRLLQAFMDGWEAAERHAVGKDMTSSKLFDWSARWLPAPLFYLVGIVATLAWCAYVVCAWLVMPPGRFDRFFKDRGY